MSSRALRRLQRERDTELSSVSRSSKVKDDERDVVFEEVASDTANSVYDHDSISHKSPSGPRNPFDLVITMHVILCLMCSFFTTVRPNVAPSYRIHFLHFFIPY